MELLDTVLIATNCSSPEELKIISAEKRQRLADALEKRIPGSLATIEEWNELLMIFMDAPYEAENEKAKEKLIDCLRGNEQP